MDIESIIMIPCVIAEGCKLWAGTPLGGKHRLLSIEKSPDQQQTMFHLESYSRQYKNWHESFHICIDTSTGKPLIDLFHTSSGIHGDIYRGSGVIGIILISLPITIILSPILLLINGFYKLSEKIFGLERNTHRILRKLKKDLSQEEYNLLKRAFNNFQQGKTFKQSC